MDIELFVVPVCSPVKSVAITPDLFDMIDLDVPVSSVRSDWSDKPANAKLICNQMDVIWTQIYIREGTHG